MTRTGYAWRAGVLAFAALSAVVVVVGAVVTMVDPQYEATSTAMRPVVGLFGGLVGAIVVSPATALLGAVIGVVSAARSPARGGGRR